MKRALIFLLVLGIIFTVFSLSFFSDYESEYVGLTKVYYNYISINQYFERDGTSLYYNTLYGGTILDDEFYLGFDFETGGENFGGYTPSGEYRVKGFVGVHVDENDELRFVGEPFEVDVILTYGGHTDNGFSKPYVHEIHVRYEPFTFAGIINSNVSLYWDNSMKFEDVENIIDFGVFILDFIKSLFVLIGNIFYSMGVLF